MSKDKDNSTSTSAQVLPSSIELLPPPAATIIPPSETDADTEKGPVGCWPKFLVCCAATTNTIAPVLTVLGEGAGCVMKAAAAAYIATSDLSPVAQDVAVLAANATIDALGAGVINGMAKLNRAALEAKGKKLGLEAVDDHLEKHKKMTQAESDACYKTHQEMTSKKPGDSDKTHQEMTSDQAKAAIKSAIDAFGESLRASVVSPNTTAILNNARDAIEIKINDIAANKINSMVNISQEHKDQITDAAKKSIILLGKATTDSIENIAKGGKDKLPDAKTALAEFEKNTLTVLKPFEDVADKIDFNSLLATLSAKNYKVDELNQILAKISNLLASQANSESDAAGLPHAVNPKSPDSSSSSSTVVTSSAPVSGTDSDEDVDCVPLNPPSNKGVVVTNSTPLNDSAGLRGDSGVLPLIPDSHLKASSKFETPKKPTIEHVVDNNSIEALNHSNSGSSSSHKPLKPYFYKSPAKKITSTESIAKTESIGISDSHHYDSALDDATSLGGVHSNHE